MAKRYPGDIRGFGKFGTQICGCAMKVQNFQHRKSYDDFSASKCIFFVLLLRIFLVSTLNKILKRNSNVRNGSLFMTTIEPSPESAIHSRIVSRESERPLRRRWVTKLFAAMEQVATNVKMQFSAEDDGSPKFAKGSRLRMIKEWSYTQRHCFSNTSSVSATHNSNCVSPRPSMWRGTNLGNTNVTKTVYPSLSFFDILVSRMETS